MGTQWLGPEKVFKMEVLRRLENAILGWFLQIQYFIREQCYLTFTVRRVYIQCVRNSFVSRVYYGPRMVGPGMVGPGMVGPRVVGPGMGGPGEKFSKSRYSEGWKTLF